MKILVTGSNGLLGQKLTVLLSYKRDVDLIVTARKEPSLSFSGNFRLMDISDEKEVDNIIASTRPDVIINTAAITQVDACELDPEKCRKTNVQGVENLIKASGKYNIHLVHLSTDFVFDGTRELLDENAVPNPVNQYGRSKHDAEVRLTQSNIQWCIIRTVLVYGVTDDMGRSNIVLWVKNSLQSGKTIQVVADQWRTPTLVEDLAEACYMAAVKKARGIYHVSGKDYLSVYQIALRTAAFFKLEQSLIKPTDSTGFSQPGRRPLKTGFVIDKARKDLGYEPHSFDEGLAVVDAQLVKRKMEIGN